MGGPLRDIVLLNSGAALVIAGRAADLTTGIELAARSLDSGAAQEVLEALVARSSPSRPSTSAIGRTHSDANTPTS